jgi:hypothetical protein
MARQANAVHLGAETAWLPTVAADAGPDGYGAGTVAPTIDSTVFRSGRSSYLCNPGSTGTSWLEAAITPGSGVTVWGRIYFRVDMLPSNATVTIARWGTVNLFSVRLTSGGALRLYNESAGTQIGSDSVLVVAPDRWYRIEFSGVVATGASEASELRVADDTEDDQPGTTVASATGLNITNTQPTVVRFGAVTAPGNAMKMWLDDGCVNDSTGTKQNSWPGGGMQGFATPWRATTLTNWVSCKGTAPPMADVQAALGARPPAGHADITNDTVVHQLRTSANSYLTLQMDGYAKEGFPGNLRSDKAPAGAGQSFGLATIVEKIALKVWLAGGALVAVEAFMRKTGSPTDGARFVACPDDGSGFPDEANPLTMSSEVLAADMSSATGVPYGEWEMFTFDPAALPDVSDGVWLVSERTGALDDTNYYRWISTTGDPPANRVRKTKTGAGWGIDQISDLAVRIYTSGGQGEMATVQYVVVHGEASATNTKTLNFEGTKSPIVANVQVSAGLDAGAVGTFPAQWRFFKSAVVYEPVMSSADISPEFRIGKVSGTDVVDICLVGTYFEWSPTAPG